MVVQINNFVHRCVQSLRTWTPGHRGVAAPASDEMASDHRVAVPSLLPYPHTSLAGLLEQSADRFGDAEAVVYGETHWTYAMLRSATRRLAAGLFALGVRPGDRVMMALPNCPEFVLVFMAIQRAGAVAVNAGPLMGRGDLCQLRAMTRPRVLVGLDLQASTLATIAKEDEHLKRVTVSLKDYQHLWKRLAYRAKLHQEQSRDGRTRGQAGNALLTLDRVLAIAPSCPPTVAPDPDDVAVLQPTGGTSGDLKVVQLSHRNLLANAMQLSVWQRVRPAMERVISVLPMFHVYGLTTCLTTSIFNAATIIPLTRFNVKQLVRTIVAHQPTILPLAPAIIEPLCARLETMPRAARAQVADAIAAATVTSGAAPLTPELSQRFTALTGGPIVQGYGLTEAAPVTHANPPHEVRLGSIGLPLPDTRVRIAALEDSATLAPAGEPGELMVAGPQVMRGYLDNPEEDRRVLYHDDEGTVWLRTGDVVCVDPEGYTSIVDRRKDMINCGGFKVFPAKVERVLEEHEAVREAAVVGRRDPKKTQIVVAVVVPVEADAALADVLRAHCRRSLAPYEVPQSIEFATELPRTPLGKLQRFRLEDDTMGATNETMQREEGA